MAPTKLVDRDAPSVVTNGATVQQRASRLPTKIRFPILLALTFFIRTLLWTAVTDFTGPELGYASKVEENGTHVLAHLAYRIALLWFTWQANYDWVDVAALAALTNLPYAYLLSTYYNISPYTVGGFVAIEVISITFPTLLLRPQAPLHNANYPLRNRFLLESFQVQWSTALLATGVYVVVLWSALKTGLLNVFLVSHFDLPTLEGAHYETVLTLGAKVAIAGIAARAFLLNPSIGAASGSATPSKTFDPVTADLSATLKHNIWFFDRRTRTLIKQTAVMSAFLLANTIQRTLTLKGSDVVGAAGYAGIWIFATVVTAGWWAWVGDTEEVLEE